MKKKRGPQTPDRTSHNKYDDYNVNYYILSESHTDPARVKKEREKARKLKKTQWWLNQINRGICHYCGKQFKPNELTLDHIVPIARGGTSTAGNVVAACRSCNENKKLDTPVDRILREIDSEDPPEEN